MLTRIKVEGFKSFKSQEVAIAPTTLLIGANASGKSNLLDALRFLQGMSLGYTITDTLRGYWEGGRLIWPGIRGDVKEACFRGGSRFLMESLWGVEDNELCYLIECVAEPAWNVAEEFFHLNTAKLFSLKDKIRKDMLDVNIFVIPAISDGNFFCGASRAFLSLHDARLKFPKLMCDAIVGMLFLDPLPPLMRNYVPQQAQTLGTSGENLSAVMWRLCQDPTTRDDFIDWLRELCAPEIDSIDFVTTELGDVMLKIVEPGGTIVSARSMSDGTLRFLCQLVALKTLPEGTLLVMEDFDAGLHPSRLYLLVDLLVRVARERRIQVIATTHSPATLQRLPDDVLADTVVFGRSPEVEGTVMRRLGDLPGFAEAVKETGIDRLFASGWIERSL